MFLFRTLPFMIKKKGTPRFLMSIPEKIGSSLSKHLDVKDGQEDKRKNKQTTKLNNDSNLMQFLVRIVYQIKN